MNPGWVTEADHKFKICEADLLVSFPLLVASYMSRNKADPQIIKGIERDGSNKLEERRKTNPAEGNRWRKQSQGHRVLAFPIWLYCDDTSGNKSKKWNKHNSFLFTATGLPRKFVHCESNIHFLSTSNTAPPLEMLDGIVDQLEECQKHGIWAWDAEYLELVLVIPSILAMLGDNPMQRKYFCRVCWVKGEPEADEEENDSDVLSDASSASSASSQQSAFMSVGWARNRAESLIELRTQFTTSSLVGGQAGFKRRKTDSGIKDTFQGAFLDHIFAISTKRGRRKVQKQADVNRMLQTFPKDITSPVWRIKDLDPHQDTPVEILHVILLGFVKYFWRDAVAWVAKSDKETLIVRLSSFNISGLGVSPLAGHTLPHIMDIDKYTVQLEAAIKHFLDCTCRLTLRWFNKPKFHVILHLPAHIRCFGPAMLFATEGFESFNAIIRSCSVHSNRHAPSLDIASKMARGNRVRHLLSRGYFPLNQDFKPKVTRDQLVKSPWMEIPLKDLKWCTWSQAGLSPLRFMELNSFGSQLLGWEPPALAGVPPGSCEGAGQAKLWANTKSAAWLCAAVRAVASSVTTYRGMGNLTVAV
ncbi:hypothetical protein B0H10DRAFT_2314156 [Mycena sp. CBHHK59/15]|nr:hypothetical protein B0H10DRAFT_2314156 [Mycena sp. CBHHK59/15]